MTDVIAWWLKSIQIAIEKLIIADVFAVAAACAATATTRPTNTASHHHEAVAY